MRLTKIFISTVMAALITTASYAGAGTQHSGVVLETVTGGGYTYINVEEKGKKFWIAGPETSVRKGARVSFSEQVWMKGFKSKALNRTFDSILFVSGVEAGQSTPVPSKATPASEPPAVIEGAYTIEQVYSKTSELRGKLVKVRGKVVKVSDNIMGRTWVHIQDGTGSEGSDKLIFRSKSESAVVGSVVIAEGILETDKDFGFGYFYPVIVEDSTFSK